MSEHTIGVLMEMAASHMFSLESMASFLREAVERFPELEPLADELWDDMLPNGLEWRTYGE